MTETNIMGTPVVNDPTVCTACQLAKMLEGGVFTTAIDAGHSDCEAKHPGECACGCEYSAYKACRECLRKGTTLDEGGQCVDRRDCANTIVADIAKANKEHAARKAAAPAKTRAPSNGPKPDCHCGCGEKTGGGRYRPGHDARHVSRLTSEVRAGRALADAEHEVAHSDALVGKLRKAVG